MFVCGLTMKASTPLDIASLARYILSPECRSVAILSGAGVSVASGIPDFRSPGGMYDTLRPELITASEQERQLMGIDPTYVVSWDIFARNAFPYLEVRRPFILGTAKEQWKATIAHRFAELLHVKTAKLTRIYTQNIDGLDHQCDAIPTEKIVSVHGTISKVECEGCGASYPFDDFCEKVQSNIRDIYNDGTNDTEASSPTKSSPIPCLSCGRPLVKPNTVLFGRNLPSEFFVRAEEDLPGVDLLIIAGTSLVVSPANSLVYNVPETTTRVVINLDEVGAELGIDYDNEDANDADKTDRRDLFLRGTCDEVFLNLIEELGWFPDLQKQVDLLPESSANLVRQRTG